jgi:hypothetical protein
LVELKGLNCPESKSLVSNLHKTPATFRVMLHYMKSLQ